jgi:adenine-specific DNA-methyltransferase
MAIRKSAKQIGVETYKHDETRKNIPTEELREFAPDVEEPQKLLWPRNPDLDPQLVWKGKDEQDRDGLEVPVVPVYIQEKIQPRAIIEDLRAVSRGDAPPQLSLFSEDFNGLDFDQLIDFYHHEQGWTNRMILGDSLLVMTSLAEKEGLRGKVQCIYMDPPYGIKFGSNWQASTAKRNVKDGAGADFSQEPEVIRAFRDTWELGINSYLSYLRDRFATARDLLTESGSIFVQIGDENVHLVRSVMDEVFGASNFCAQLAFQKTGGFEVTLVQRNFDYLLWYARDKPAAKFRPLFQTRSITQTDTAFFDTVELGDGERRQLTKDERANLSLLPSGAAVLARNPLSSDGYVASLHQPVDFGGETYSPPSNAHWKTTPSGIEKLRQARRLIKKGRTLRFVRYWEDYPAAALGSYWTDTGTGGFVGDDKLYVVQTDTRVAQRCLLMTTDPGDLVLDPTGGSGTTAYVSEQWGRRWITIDTSRVAMALMRTRLMAGRFPYYVLADSDQGLKKEAELTGLTPPTYKTAGDLRKGFVYKRVPHVTLKSIANNPDLQESMTRDEIDAAIARHAETELLYDEPFQDNRRIRVTGPFTVESLSPHRMLSEDVDRTESEAAGESSDAAGSFENIVIENLRANYVATTRKSERLKFSRLEHFAGRWIQAEGEYGLQNSSHEVEVEDAGSRSAIEFDEIGASDDTASTAGEETASTRTVAVSIGPEYGTVTSEQVKEAAKEAMKGAGFDLLLVLGFGFDAHASETAAEFRPEDEPHGEGFVAERNLQYGKLPILLVRMNPELWMCQGLLKKTGTGNLFTVFGEPDIEIRNDNGSIVVELRGVDVYDPTTGEVRSRATDEIACWFIDTSYNDESFFVRQAYFTGSGDPYKRLKATLRAEIDEAAWASLNSTTSRPFDIPSTGKIAVKVINHYGDEVLKVYEVSPSR